MAITATDIKLLESEVMADTSSGGGRRTSRVIADGVSGNVFPKVSRLDSVYGRVNLRKVFGAVQTADVDTYAGAHAIITDAPNNDRIHTAIFSTASDFDTRLDARDRIESYVTASAESRMILLGRQLTGQQSVVAYQREEDALPEVGDVYCLSTEVGSTVTAQQYFRVQTVDSEIRTFSELIGGSSLVDFRRRVLTIGTGAPLRVDFTGPETPTQNSAVARPSKIRSTTVVDAARYYGIKPITDPIEAGAMEVKVSSVYTPIVPTTRRETPLSAARLSGALSIVAAADAVRTETANAAWAIGSAMRTLRPIKPGSLTIFGAGVANASDDRRGEIDDVTFAATVDYETGVITRTGGSAAAASYSLSYIPGAAPSQTAQNMDVQITLGNRGIAYPLTLNPLPSPGSVTVDYRALGKWYRLRDDGAGALKGDDVAYGSGTIDYTTGAAVITLGALPDVGSSLLTAWATPLHYRIRAGATVDPGIGGKVKMRITLPDSPVVPDTFSATYTSDGDQYPFTDDSAGVISGVGVAGKIDYSAGIVDLEFTTRLPDRESVIPCLYSQQMPVDPADVVVRSMSVPAAETINLGTGVVPGSFNGAVTFGGALGGHIFIADNGAGLVVARGGQQLLGFFYQGAWKWSGDHSSGAKDARISSDQVIGSINYSTGVVTITNGVVVDYNKYTPRTRVLDVETPASWDAATTVITVSIGATANFGWKDSGVSVSAAEKTFDAEAAVAGLRLDLLPTVAERIVPGSLIISIAGLEMIDRNGTLYSGVSPVTGAGSVSGTVNYDTGEVVLSAWQGVAPSLAVESCLTSYGPYSAYELFFRTAGAPIRSGSFYIQATTADGVLLSATANDSGVISGTKVSGTIDQETGIVRLLFGEVVPAAGNESEWWFNANAVVGGQIFRPEPIIPSTLSYNAVVLANLPLNADILGLDPVRLPTDGRVPIFRPADVVVIHNTQTLTLQNPVLAGETYQIGRADLAEVAVVDANGAPVNPAQYIVDLAAGEITMAQPLSLPGVAQPLKVLHRVEDLALVSDVQINGLLTVSAPISHDFPADSTYVSSAILFGDLAARVEHVFDLLAFLSWSDTPGPGATAEFNRIDFPIEVLNNGAINERWRISFTTTDAFQVIGETLGVIATGTRNADLAPANVLTGNPYFVIRAQGWGGGWSAGNQLRFNTVAASAPIWVARTVLPGASLEGDSFSLQMRGDVDAE